MLVAESISYAYGNHVALDRVTSAIVDGSLTAIVGPNGSGKSTLLRCLSGFLRPTSGRVSLNGRPLEQIPTRVLCRESAFCPQEIPPPFTFTVAEYVAMSLPTINPRSEAFRENLETLDLAGLADRLLPSLSGGQRQRATVARALAQNTPHLLLDEPTAHLDLRHQGQLLQHLRRRSATHGVAIAIVLHDINLAFSYADRILLLAQSRLIAQGSPEELLHEETLGRAYQTKIRIHRSQETHAAWIDTPAAEPAAGEKGF